MEVPRHPGLIRQLIERHRRGGEERARKRARTRELSDARDRAMSECQQAFDTLSISGNAISQAIAAEIRFETAEHALRHANSDNSEFEKALQRQLDQANTGTPEGREAAIQILTRASERYFNLAVPIGINDSPARLYHPGNIDASRRMNAANAAIKRLRGTL